ncbi:hypothetical protein BQ8794_270072 [Mesorhizobium prunaredense]|uniref:Uncharacterized protein n=1 Tax=Mesorhizobium prunaredense TaxID=1631249 RepID=A0A1R3V8M3_9HYPH|nr:hypothetical protein BQ8794_270072 [Mesorhizobium prunaredense]
MNIFWVLPASAGWGIKTMCEESLRKRENTPTSVIFCSKKQPGELSEGQARLFLISEPNRLVS